MKIYVLGGCGRQGSIIAQDLARKHEVVALDITKSKRLAKPVKFLKADCSSYNVLRDLLTKAGLVVGALPSHLGMNAMMAAIDSGVHYVDLSFCAQDLSSFNSSAMHKKLTVLHDCGVAPGLSHLIVGQALKQGVQNIQIAVGGVAKDREEDYIVTWSPEDLYEEYTRPARIVVEGEVRSVPACSGVRTINAGSGLQSYVTDGLRSLLSKAHMTSSMVEYTLRWPNHIENLGPLGLMTKEEFAEKITSKYKSNTDDKLVMQITANMRPVTLTVEGDDELSAMSKATAYSCSAFAQLVASGNYFRTGVIPPEDVALDDEAYKFVLDCLAEHGIEFDNTRYPFLEER